MAPIPRILRLGVVADRRRSPEELAVLIRAVAAARLGLLWVSQSPPTGPLPEVQRAALEAQAAAAGVALAGGASRWDAAPAAGRAFVPSWPGRRLAEIISSWSEAGDEPGRLVVEVPVSVGRTRAEAVARVDDWFEDLGHPRDQGIFGTIEDGQDQVTALVAVGVGELCCVLPRRDALDVIAQLSAVGVAAPTGSGPGPPSPPTWGDPARLAIETPPPAR